MQAPLPPRPFLLRLYPIHDVHRPLHGVFWDIFADELNAQVESRSQLSCQEFNEKIQLLVSTIFFVKISADS